MTPMLHLSPAAAADVPDPLFDAIKGHENGPLLVNNFNLSSQKRPFLDSEVSQHSSEHLAKRARGGGGGKVNRVACKARGMADSHNGDTAYFEIPESCKHGQILICSHPDCATSGRRFRYCAVCKLPVAKRNFMKRHAHGLVSSPKELDGELGEGLTCGFIQDQRPGDKEDSGDSESDADADSDSPRPGHRRVVSFDGSNNKGHTLPSNDDAFEAVELSKYEFDWLGLLRRRPSVEDQNSMTTWMSKILDHSEDSQAPLTPEQNSLLAAPLFHDDSTPSRTPELASTPELAPASPPRTGVVTPPTERQIVDARHVELSGSGGILTDIDFTKVFDDF